VVLVLVSPADLDGVVVDVDGAPIARADLILTRAPVPDAAQTRERGASGTTPLAWATTEPNGRFTLRAPGPGDYLVTAWARGFAPREVFVALATERSSERLVLKTLADVRGVVRGPDGRPAAGAAIVACGDGDVVELVSRNDGRFLLPGRTVGCTVVARHPQFSHSVPVRVRAAEELRLELGQGGAIYGLVTTTSGHSVPGVELLVPAQRHHGRQPNLRGRATRPGVVLSHD
jgi:hypothetical protein